MERELHRMIGQLFGMDTDLPETIGQWLSEQQADIEKTCPYRATVDGIALSCGHMDGFLALTVDGRDDEKVNPVMMGSVTIGIFDAHRGRVQMGCFSPESAKQIVNRLGEAISEAERIRREIDAAT